MHYIIFPSKDCTIYSKYPEINTGLDEILDIDKEISASSIYFNRGTWKSGSYYKRFDYVESASSQVYYYAIAENIYEIPGISPYWKEFNAESFNNNSRILIQFDLNKIPTDIQASASAVYLNLFTCISRKVPVEYELNVHPMSVEWEMGTGNFTEKLGRDGATWYRASQLTEWAATDGGGDYFTGIISSQSFNFNSSDIRMDIKNVFDKWVSGSNYGLIIKRPDSDESSYEKLGKISFYSLDTHTVYPPTLEVVYDDHIYDLSGFISASTYLSESIISTEETVEEVTILTGSIYYLSASVSESLATIITAGSYPSSSLIYTTAGITSSVATRNIDNSWYISSSIFYYDSASVSYLNIGLQSGDSYYSASINYISKSVSSDSILTVTQSFVSSSMSSSLMTTYTQISASLISGSVDITLKDFQPVYRYETIPRFKLNVREKYQVKTFYEQLRPSEVKYLPDSIQYSVRDAYTNRILVPYSDYSRVSLNSEGHYFDLPLYGFMPERFYKIHFKLTINNIDYFFDKNNVFKVIK